MSKRVEGFMYVVGDVLTPKDMNRKNTYLKQIIIEDIHPESFMYSVIDWDGDCWSVSTIALEHDFVRVGAKVG